MYVILGGGRVGARVAELLLDSNKAVHVVDVDATRAEALQERRFAVTQADMTTLDFRKDPFKDAEAFLILARDDAANAKTVRTIKKMRPDVPIVVRASTQGTAKEFREAGANYVVVG